LAGCGGDGNGAGPGPGPGPQGSSVNRTLLNKPGIIEVTFNTGQGRAPGSPTAVLKRLNFVDDLFPPGDSRNNIDTLLNPSRNLQLDGYTSQTISVNVPMNNIGFSGPVSGRFFDEYRLDIDSLLIEQPGGGFQTVTGPGGQPVLLEIFPANILTLAGRTTSLQIFLDDAMLNFDGTDVIFDRDLFEQVNLTDDGNGNFKLMGFIGDYIVFDITNVANKPTMSDSSPATRVWFSGDSIALSGDVGSGPEAMEVLTPLAPPIEGLFLPPVVLPGGTGPGTYTLRQVDPRDLSNIARITALNGVWKDYVDPDTSRSPFLNLGTFECFTFPQSLNQDRHDMVVLVRDGGGNITTMYFGEMDFGANSFSIWPIDQVDDGDASNELDGDLSGLLDVNGSPTSNHRHVRSGTFTITSGIPPSGFQTSARFIVYRL
jgi:hypothetical protein